jgi:hypothetical protein
MSPGQFTAHYKTNRTPSVLPIRALFDPAKFKNKKPTPNENTFVSINGRLDGVVLDSNNIANFFSVVIDSICFLGKGPVSTPATGTTGQSMFFFLILFFIFLLFRRLL